MNCTQARQWISPYLDSELDGSTTFEVSRHLEQCPECRIRFEREAEADRLIAEHLGRYEPVVDWNRIDSAIREPYARRMPLRPRWMLAAAACIAFVIIGLSDWSSRSNAQPAHWAVEELHRLTPDGQPFPTRALFSDHELQDLAEQVIARGLRLPAAEADGHRPMVITAIRRSCRAGKNRLEVHMNCCGKPILLTIGHCDNMGELSDVKDALDVADNSILTTQQHAYDDVFNICARKTDDYIVVAVSSHPVVKLVLNTTLSP